MCNELVELVAGKFAIMDGYLSLRHPPPDTQEKYRAEARNVLKIMAAAWRS